MTAVRLETRLGDTGSRPAVLRRVLTSAAPTPHPYLAVLAHQPDLSVLDVTKYCIAAGHGTSKLVASNAYGWYCTSPSAPVGTTAACNLVYHVNDAVSPVRRLRPAPTPSWV